MYKVRLGGWEWVLECVTLKVDKTLQQASAAETYGVGDSENKITAAFRWKEFPAVVATAAASR